jgi:small subunit ribosomal protein S21|tara:strand:+ start:2766 stop:2990 length:225 start_codon:yes stop_codon:yes gene_type:complete
MTTVRLREKENFDKLLRRFKKAVDRSGIMQEIKDRAEYEKPSAKRKREKDTATRKYKKRLAQNSQTKFGNKTDY